MPLIPIAASPLSAVANVSANAWPVCGSFAIRRPPDARKMSALLSVTWAAALSCTTPSVAVHIEKAPWIGLETSNGNRSISDRAAATGVVPAESGADIGEPRLPLFPVSEVLLLRGPSIRFVMSAGHRCPISIRTRLFTTFPSGVSMAIQSCSSVTTFLWALKPVGMLSVTMAHPATRRVDLPLPATRRTRNATSIPSPPRRIAHGHARVLGHRAASSSSSRRCSASMRLPAVSRCSR
jgi:hypothetical protein